MERSEVWKQCVKALILSLLDAPSSSARETGKVWEWAFSRLEEHPDDFNSLQDNSSDIQISLVKKFLKTCEVRAQGQTASDHDVVEYVADHSLSVSDAPITKKVSHEVADALAAFGMFLGHKGHSHNTIDSPSRFPYTAALFGFHDQIFKDILESKQIPDGQRSILEEIAKYIPKGDVQREYFKRCEVASNVERLFGFSKRLLTATDVYQRGLDFYKTSSRLGPAMTLTFSNTSGLWNPLERSGTAEFVRCYGVVSKAQLKYKDAFRSTNFIDGILNPALACRRLYLFNELNTWNAFKNARAAAQDKAKFDEHAKILVEEVCKRIESAVGTLHLVAVKNWQEFPPLGLVTRVSSDVVMFSNRGSDLAISHAFWCNLSEQGRSRSKTLSRVSTVLKATSEMVSGGMLTVLSSVAPFLETLLGRLEYVTKLKERFTGERMRRLLDDEPIQILSELDDQFGLDLEYITPTMLRQKLSEFIQ